MRYRGGGVCHLATRDINERLLQEPMIADKCEPEENEMDDVKEPTGADSDESDESSDEDSSESSDLEECEEDDEDLGAEDGEDEDEEEAMEGYAPL